MIGGGGFILVMAHGVLIAIIPFAYGWLHGRKK